MPEIVEKVKPRLSRGLNDLLPAQMLARQSMIDTIRGVYENYGFVPLSTPAIEYMDVLRGTSETQKKIFGVVSPEKEDLGLRYDLTVPLARVFAMNREMPRPFRRYQVSPVWRPDKPDKGRYREFTQFDLDSVGVVSEIADTEILAGMCDTLAALKVGRYSVRYSSRALLNLLLTYAEIPHAQGAEVFRVLDKMDKAGAKRVRLELTTGFVDSSGDPIPGLGLSEPQVDKIDRFLAIRADDRREVIGRVRELFVGIEEAAGEIDVVERISNHLYALGYGDGQVTLDLSIARGLDYYTGPVFESSLLDAPEFGSIFSGGRYDDLVTRFLGEKVPAVGSSVGVDRLLAALEHLGRTDRRRATAQVLVINMDAALASEYVAMTWELRRAGIATELYIGTQKGPGKQLKYADYYEIPVVVLVGSDEKERGIVTLKDMVVGREKAAALAERRDWLEARPGQREAPRADLVDAVRRMLAEIAGGDAAGGREG